MAKGQGISGITSSAAIKKIERVLCCDNRQKVPQASARSQVKIGLLSLILFDLGTVGLKWDYFLCRRACHSLQAVL